MIDLAPPPPLWLPPKPAIIRAGKIERAPLPFAVMVPGIAPVIAGNAARLTYLGNVPSGADTNTYDFGDAAIPYGGNVIVIALLRATGTVSSVSIGGSAATLHHAVAGTGNTGAIASRVVSAGDHNISVACSGSPLRATIFVWVLTNYRSTTPTNTFKQDGTTTSRDIALDIAGGGVAVYAAYVVTATAQDFIWTGATERDTFNLEGVHHCGNADKRSAVALTGDTVNLTWQTSVNSTVFGASFR